LTGPEAVRLNTIASRMKISTKELLRQAAHIPVPKPVKSAGADAAGAGATATGPATASAAGETPAV
jgi:hypothetical protein